VTVELTALGDLRWTKKKHWNRKYNMEFV